MRASGVRAIVYPAALTRADELLQINERFVEARRSYEGIVEQSYAQHTQPPPRTPNDMSAALTRAEQYRQQPGPHRYPSQPDPQQPPQSYAPQPAPPKCVTKPKRASPCSTYHGQYPEQQPHQPQQYAQPPPQVQVQQEYVYDASGPSAPQGATWPPPNGEPYRQNSAVRPCDGQDRH